MFPTVNYAVYQEVAIISINRPKTCNAVDLNVHRDLFSAFQKAHDDLGVRCVVLTGEGKAFSSGADLTSIDISRQNSLDYGDYLRDTYNRLLRFMMNMKKPIVAAINGVAAGAGLSLALACDYRLASEEASLSVAFVKIGLIPDAGACFFLPRILGLGKALELASVGDSLSAEQAERIGLVNRVIPEEEFDNGVMDFAKLLASLPTSAIGRMKEIMYRSFENDLDTVLTWEEEGQRSSGTTEDHREGVLAFLQKRQPVFKGK